MLEIQFYAEQGEGEKYLLLYDSFTINLKKTEKRSFRDGKRIR